MVDDAKLAEIEARVEAATPGPWRHEFAGERGAMGDSEIFAPTDVDGDEVYIAVVDRREEPPWDRDAEFIAHAREDVPALLARVRELVTEQEKTRKFAEALCEYDGVMETASRELVKRRNWDFFWPDRIADAVLVMRALRRRHRRTIRTAADSVGVSSAASGEERNG